MEMAGNRRSSKRRIRTRSSVDVDVDESSNNGGGVIEKRCLSDIPSDLWEQIMSKLFFADQINFRAVCKLWRSFDNLPPPLKQMPWLMVLEFNENWHWYYYDEKEYKNISWDSCKLVDPAYNKTYTIDMSSMNKKKNLKDCIVKIHESKYSWLLMSCESKQNSTSLFFYTPFFIDNNIIELPVLSVQPHYNYIAAFDLISNPNKKEESVSFEVLVLSSGMCRTIYIQTCRQGDDSWSFKKTNWNFELWMIKCWVYSEGIFYYMAHVENKFESGCYDIARNSWTKFPTVLEPERTRRDLKMIKFDGELYLISVNKNDQRRPNTQNLGSMCVDIYKFDLLKGTWESPIHNLDDRVLFVGGGYSSILELDNDVKELKDQRQNVYYCYCVIVHGWYYYATILKYCNALDRNKSYSKWYGSLAKGNQDCKTLWIDPPHHIRNCL